MTVNDFDIDPDFHGPNYYDTYDSSPAIKPSKFVVIAAFACVLFGGIWAIFGALGTLGFLNIDSPQWWGVLTYLLTLLAPAGFIIYLRHFQFRHSLPKDGEDFANFDSHSTNRVALTLRKISIMGVFFSLFAILIMVWPLAQEWS